MTSPAHLPGITDIERSVEGLFERLCLGEWGTKTEAFQELHTFLLAWIQKHYHTR